MKLYQLADGTFVGTQAEAKASEQTWEPFEFPINPKEETIRVLNELLTKSAYIESTTEYAVEPPKLSEADEFYLTVRQNIAEANVDLEEILWRAPLDTCIRLDSIVSERIREHFANIEKEKKNDQAAPN